MSIRKKAKSSIADITDSLKYLVAEQGSPAHPGHVELLKLTQEEDWNKLEDPRYVQVAAYDPLEEENLSENSTRGGAHIRGSKSRFTRLAR